MYFCSNFDACLMHSPFGFLVWCIKISVSVCNYFVAQFTCESKYAVTYLWLQDTWLRWPPQSVLLIKWMNNYNVHMQINSLLFIIRGTIQSRVHLRCLLHIFCTKFFELWCKYYIHYYMSTIFVFPCRKTFLTEISLSFHIKGVLHP